MSTSAQPSSRSRNQNRKKVNDDASYLGPPLSTSSGTKRQATERAEGEPRMKRKRVDPVPPPVSNKVPESENRISLVDFVKMPTPLIYRYLSQFDLIPTIRPLPITVDDPPPTYTFSHSYRQQSRAPSPQPVATPANRPRRDLKEQQVQSRRRSSRLLEEDLPRRTPIYADVHELHVVLAGVAEQHFREMPPVNGKEIDTLVAFMCAVEKSKAMKPR